MKLSEHLSGNLLSNKIKNKAEIEMKVIIWDLPEEQIRYLKKNCKEQFKTGEICIMNISLAKSLLEQIKKK